MNPILHRPCPDDEVLQELAAGISSPEQAEQTMQHVARCSICGPALRRYVREFSGEETPENAQILAQLESSKPQWQRRLAKKLVGHPRRATWLKMVPAFAGLAVAILAVIAGPAFLADLKIKKAQNGAAAAFAGRRTTEMRLPSVAYSPYNPFPTELGGTGSRELDEMPPELTSASSAANENLKEDKADPRWLEVQGRALLWASTSGSLERAEKDFEKARSEGLDTPSLEIDLAASYFERDTRFTRDNRTEHPNLQRSLNLLNEVLSKPKLSSEDRASALYNLAIAYEKTQAWDLAVATWEKYLEVDPSSGWANEARQHLKDAKAKISIGAQPNYSDPSFFLQQVVEGSLRPEDPEQYQQRALSQWLPVAIKNKESPEYKALLGLAEVFAGHQDFWWRDFLAETGPKGLSAVQELTSAVLANEQGRYGEAITHAHVSIIAFKNNKNLPGELIARLQETYALRSKLEGATCLARADPLVEHASKTDFIWLRAQSLLERAQCRNFQVELAKSDEDSTESLRISRTYHFPVLTLRIHGIAAGMQRQQGKYDDAWARAAEGMGLFWQGSYPAERLDQFYAVMFQGAEDSGLPYLAEALLRHTIATREQLNTKIQRNPIREGMLHLELANLLKQRPGSVEAEQQAQIASSRLDTAAHDYPEDFRIFEKLRPAESDLQHQEAERALASLQSMRTLIERTQYKELALNYYRLLGGVHFRLRHFDEAASSFEAAIGIANSALESLRNDQDRQAWKRATDESYRGEVRVLLAQKKDRKALEEWEQYKNWPLLEETDSSNGRNSQNSTGELIHTALSIGSSPAIRLIYASFQDGLQIWAVRNNHIQSSWVSVPRADLENDIRIFAEQCATPDSDLNDLDKQGLKLYALLIQPVVATLSDSQTVVIEFDESLHGLSIEGLKTPGGPYFGAKYAILYSPGIWMERSLRTPELIVPSASLLLLDATRSPGSVYLPGMDAERKAISTSFTRSRIVDTANTNWDSTRSQLASSEVFIFMGHGRVASTGTDLVLNDKQSVGAKDFTKDVLFRSQMVVLAACSTGRGKGLLDTQNLVHSFLAAGVPRVVASRWDVDSESTSQLMISFYQHVTARQTAAQAMLDARKQVLATKVHPYYWAGFSVTGRVN
jgi:CHAT domain-containing protein